MFIEKNTRQFATFMLSEPDEATEYAALLNNPAIRIVNRKIVPITETTSETSGDSTVSSSITRYQALLEYEEVSL